MALDLVWQMGLDDAQFRAKLEGSRSEVDKAAKGMNLAMSAGKLFAGITSGLNVLSAGAKALRGDFIGMADTLERLPLGVGQIVKSARDLMMEWSGVTAEIEASSAAIEAQNEVMKKKTAQAASGRQLGDLATELERQAALGTTEGFARRRMEELQKLNKVMEQIDRLARSAGSGLNQANRSNAEEQARRIAEQNLNAIDAEEKAAKAREAERAASEAENLRRAQTSADLDQQALEVERLRLEGKEKEADLLENELRLRKELEQIADRQGITEAQRTALAEASRRNAELRRKALGAASDTSERADAGPEGFRSLTLGLIGGAALSRQVFGGGGDPAAARAERRDADRKAHEQTVQTLMKGLSRSIEGIDRVIQRYSLSPATGATFGP